MVASSMAGRARHSAWHCALLGVLLLLDVASGEAQTEVKQVLVLQSVSRGNLTLDHFTSAFRISLDQRIGKPVNAVQVVVGPTGLVGAPEQAVVDYLRSMYGDRPPDLIMTVGGPAALFARKHRQQLFHATPLLFAALNQRYLRDSPLGENESAVTVVNELPLLVDDILRVLPETRQIFMVTGSGAIGRITRPELERGFARFRDRVNFVWSDQLSLADILQRVASLPAHSAIVFQTFGTDGQGASYPAEQVVAALHATANAPLFSAYSPYFGRGIVGGSMMDIDTLAFRTADVASRLLNGERPGSVRPAPQLRGPPIYDWRELQRWRIPESRLPPGSVVRFRRPSLWEAHRLAVLIAIGALVLQSLLIARLLYEHRARQRAEMESRRNLDLAADTNRRETISALTTSIGHELGQPLSAIVLNAQALQMMSAINRALPDDTQEILDDIQSEAVHATQIIDRHRTLLRSHQMEKKPMDLHAVIDETLALVANDLRMRQIETTLELASTPCIIDGDEVLMAQVLINLFRNAMDALVDAPRAKRRITIRTAVQAADVELSVSDTGSGLPPEVMGTLFTPFGTTKSHGLGIGLTIVQRIVDVHGGTVAAQENITGGATLTVTLPCSTTHKLPSGRAHTTIDHAD
jgi:signal transduction histidine kinase